MIDDIAGRVQPYGISSGKILKIVIKLQDTGYIKPTLERKSTNMAPNKVTSRTKQINN